MTNGAYKKRYNKLIAENFEWIRISLDTLDEKKYKQWKGVDGVKIIKRNLEDFKQYENRKVRVGINCNVGPNITLQHAKDLVDWVNNSDEISYLQFRPILPRYYKDAETSYKRTGTSRS